MEKKVIEEVRKRLGAARKMLETADIDLENARRAGLDITEIKKRRDDLAEKLHRMELVYGRTG